MKRRRVFQIGFNKCGTKSIGAYLRGCGYKHFDFSSEEEGFGAVIIAENIKARRPILYGLEKYDSFSDLEYVTPTLIVEAYKEVERLFAEYPEAKYILNIRDKNYWIESRCRQAGGNYLKFFQQFYDAPCEKIIQMWSESYDQHIAKVKKVIPEENLFILNLESIDEPELAEFLGISNPPQFEERHVSIKGRLASMIYPFFGRLPIGLRQAIPERTKNTLKKL